MKPQKILIIEDTPQISKMYKIGFEMNQFDVTLAINGIEGITKAVETKPDIILLDLLMDQMNGYEVLEGLKNNSSLCCPIIVCSNLSQKKDILRATESGADLFLKKADYTPKEVVQEVLQFLKKYKPAKSPKLKQESSSIMIVESDPKYVAEIQKECDKKSFSTNYCKDGLSGL